MIQGATGNIFGGRKCMLHRVSFLLHRAKKILYEKEGETVRVRNTAPVLVNHSCLCATPGQRVWSNAMHRCFCDSLYIGRYRSPISILAQKPPRIDFLSNFFKILKATREANVGRIRALGVRNLLSCF